MIQDDNNKDYILVGGDDMEISVVRTEDHQSSIYNGATNKTRHGRLWHIIAIAMAVVAAILLAVVGYIYYQRHINIGVPISRSPKENIDLLEKMMNGKAQAQSGVTLTSDSILGVALDFYKLEGLRGTLQMNEPDTTDTSVYLYVRSADYLADGILIGSTVVEGQPQKSTSDQRNAYVAMAGKGMVIGVSRSNKVKDFVEEKGGSFFRQFILVSNGVLPRQFYLHGKVERRALGRIGDTLYIICTRHKETMWDFADALREYGFVDAVYITGGDDRTFYRTADGEAHVFGTDSTHTQKVPWLVFKK